MTDLATLRADINEWTSRNDLTTPSSTIIRMAEAEFARKIRLKAQERSTTITVDSGVYNTTTDHPSGDLRILKVIVVAFPGGRQLPIKEVSPVTLRTVDFTAETGRPRIFAQEGCSLLFSPRPDTGTATVDLILSYFERFATLSMDADTNELLTNHYDLVLNCALSHAAKLLQDWESESMYRGYFEKAVEELRIDQNRARRGNNFMETTRRFTP